mgnify:CR=1 FL=1
MAAATTAQFLVSEDINFRKFQLLNHREIVPCAVTEVSAHQAAREERETQLGIICNKPCVKHF